MNAACYAILIINKRDLSLSLGFFSEDAKNLTANHSKSAFLDIMHLSGEDYTDACLKVQEMIHTNPAYDWLRSLV